MNKKINILTLRNVEKYPSYQIVYEWEDVLADKLNGNITNIYKSIDSYKLASLPGFLYYLMNRNKIINPSAYNIYFEMGPKTLTKRANIKLNPNINNKKNNIPIFIDFYLKENILKDFYSCYSMSPFILVTSKDTYEYLIDKKCPLKIYHYPISLPDKYEISYKLFKKEYDLILAGRTNPFLKKCLDKYCEKNQDFVYLFQKNIGNKLVYVNNKGSIILNAQSREEYLNLIRKSKIAFYSTPGIDTEKNVTNQVTPRLFELIYAQCLIIARYPKNSDTDFFELNKFIPSVNSYEDFEILMDTYRNEKDFPFALYSEFLSKHYTSVRAELLLNIIKDYEN